MTKICLYQLDVELRMLVCLSCSSFLSGSEIQTEFSVLFDCLGTQTREMFGEAKLFNFNIKTFRWMSKWPRQFNQKTYLIPYLIHKYTKSTKAQSYFSFNVTFRMKYMSICQVFISLYTAVQVVTKRTRRVCESDYYTYIHEDIQICSDGPIIRSYTTIPRLLPQLYSYWENGSNNTSFVKIRCIQSCSRSKVLGNFPKWKCLFLRLWACMIVWVLAEIKKQTDLKRLVKVKRYKFR